jgi:hypothetical protein
MNLPRPGISKKNRSQSDFPACKKTALLLKNKIETALAPFRQRRSITVYQLVRALVNFDTLPSGCFLASILRRLERPNPLWVLGLGATRYSFDKLEERKRLEMVA